MLWSDDPTELIAYIKEKGYQSINDFAYQEGMKPNTIGNAVRKFQLHHLFPNKRSALEIQIQMWISQFDDNLKHSFKMPSKREIDIYDDKLMLGFEVNGTHWHSSTFCEESYHYEKSMEAKSIGYRLIHIYEYEWIARKPQIQGFIKDLYGTTCVWYARELHNALECTVLAVCTVKGWQHNIELCHYLLLEHTLQLFSVAVVGYVKQRFACVPLTLFSNVYWGNVIFLSVHCCHSLVGSDNRNLVLDGAAAEYNAYVCFHCFYVCFLFC